MRAKREKLPLQASAQSQWPVALGLLLILVAFMFPIGKEARPAMFLGLNVDTWIRDHPLTQGGGVRNDELTRTAKTSVHVVQIPSREDWHLHRGHDLSLHLLRGKGHLEFETGFENLAAGDAVWIPSGQLHAFVNESVKPAVIVVVSAPAYDGKDSLILAGSRSEWEQSKGK